MLKQAIRFDFVSSVNTVPVKRWWELNHLQYGGFLITDLN